MSETQKQRFQFLLLVDIHTTDIATALAAVERRLEAVGLELNSILDVANMYTGEEWGEDKVLEIQGYRLVKEETDG